MEETNEEVGKEFMEQKDILRHAFRSEKPTARNEEGDLIYVKCDRKEAEAYALKVFDELVSENIFCMAWIIANNKLHAKIFVRSGVTAEIYSRMLEPYLNKELEVPTGYITEKEAAEQKKKASEEKRKQFTVIKGKGETDNEKTCKRTENPED